MEDVIVPFAVAAITPLGCAWVASRFVPPTNKWIYGSVEIGTAYLSWKYIVPRMLTSMGYPVPFEAESDYEESYDDLLDEMGESAISNYSVSWLLQQADPIAYEVGLNDYESFMLSEHEDDASMYSEWFDKDGDLTRKGEQEIPAIYDESLDEMGTEWLANKYNASWLLKRGDPIAYGVGLSDYESSMEEDFEAESFDRYGRKIRKLVGNCPVCHGFFDVEPPNPEACNCDEDFEAESFAADSEGCSECLFQDEGDDREYIYGPMIYYYGSGGYRHIPNANFCYTCGAEIEKPQTGWAAESFEAESKFIKPYDRKGKIDLRRDNKGRYRRKLSIPLKKK